MVQLAALLTGLGGLLAEMVLVRRHGALLGNTAEAAALVLGLFVLGLGAGGLAVPALRHGRWGPRRTAAAIYGAVALGVLGADVLLAGLGAVAWPAGAGLALLAPGVLAAAMGAAFPLLFALLPRGPWPSGMLVGANLAGGVAAAAWGGNVAIPSLGLAATARLAALSYGVAALLLLVGRARPDRSVAGAPRPRRLPFAAGAAPAFAAGLLVLGLEVVLLRRLPFWLEGFQPTLSGVLAACLLGLTAGAALGAGTLQWLWGRRAPYRALALGAVACALGLHELVVPPLARVELDALRSDLGVHLRVAAATLAAALVPCFALGAVVPLLVGRLRHRGTRAALAGRLLFWQGLGALAGALLAGAALPRLFPTAYFAIAPGALAILGLLACWRHGGAAVRWSTAAALLAILGAGGAGSALAPRPPMQGARYDRPLAYRHLAHRCDGGVCASVVYDRRHHSMLLFTDGFRAAETGPGTAYMEALGHLPLLLRENLRRVAVIALGTGTTAAAVTAWPDPVSVDVVEISPAVLALAPFFAADGPVQGGGELPSFLADARTHIHVADGRRFLARQPPGTLDLVTLEPLLPYAPGMVPLYSAEFYALAQRALSAHGLLVQWVPTHAMPAEHFATLLATFARGFAHHSVWLVDQSTLLIGSATPHLRPSAELAARQGALPEEVQAALHESGLARAADVAVALIGDDVLAALPDAETLHDDRPFVERIGYWSGAQKLAFLPQNLELLQRIAQVSPDGPLTDADLRALRLRRLEGLRARAWVPLHAGLASVDAARLAVRELAAARAAEPDSVLLHREETAALRLLVEREVLQRGGSGWLPSVQAHLRRDPGSALLQACAALPDARGELPPPAERQAAVAAAMALDPVLLDDPRAPAFVRALRPLAEPDALPGPLEDLRFLPPADALADLAADGGARGLALRAVFAVRVARALIARLAQRPLRDAEHEALRSILDPLSLELAAQAIAARGGSLDEIYALWRGDLAMPEPIAAALRGPVAERVALARALRAHRGSRAQRALADLLMDAEIEVRSEAGLTLFEIWGDRVPYDATWDETRRRAAAEQLRSMHNPGS